MEVHHHAHSSRKKWTHYFWEFFMLFLAVFCGFLAELQVEHKIENERGKQYTLSFYEDLKADTPHIARLIRVFERKSEALKDRASCYGELKKTGKPGDCMLQLMMNSEGFSDFVYTDRTMQQLKNAGGLRLLKKADADSILEYDKIIRFYLKSEATAMQEMQTSLRNVMYSLMNYDNFRNTVEGLPSTAPLLYEDNGQLVNRYFNLLDAYYFLCTYHLRELKALKEKSFSLIAYFKTKYHLK